MEATAVAVCFMFSVLPSTFTKYLDFRITETSCVRILDDDKCTTNECKAKWKSEMKNGTERYACNEILPHTGNTAADSKLLENYGVRNER